jgi:hypothetical protein
VLLCRSAGIAQDDALSMTPNKALQPTPESSPAPSAVTFLGGAAELGR